MMLSLSEEFIHNNSSLSSRIFAISKQKEEIGKGRGLQEKIESQSSGHKSVAKLLRSLFPANNIMQECLVSLVVKGRKTSCYFDIVDKTMKIIVEVHGAQHTKFVPFFHDGNYKNFSSQQNRDEAKIVWARQNGWTVVVIDDKDARRLGKADTTEALRELATIIANAQYSF